MHLMAEQRSIVNRYHIFFTYLPVGEHTAFFCSLAIMNNAAMNMGLESLPQQTDLTLHRRRIARSYIRSIFSFVVVVVLLLCLFCFARLFRIVLY